MTPVRFVALAPSCLLVALAIAVSGCGGTDEDEAGAAQADRRPQAQAGADELPASGRTDDEGDSGQEQLIAANGRLLLRTPAHAYPVIWVRQGHKVEMRTAPGGAGELVEEVRKRSEFGSPSVFGVIRREGRWAGVTTPALPNGQLGWIELDPKKLAAGWTRLSIDVDLSTYEARFGSGNRTLRKFTVTVGAPGSDTPTGRFAVTDTFRGDLNAAYGCCALALSATQPDLPSGWLGGNRIAIHGTYGTLGAAASHGCVRAANDDVSALVKRVPLGTPVFIHE